MNLPRKFVCTRDKAVKTAYRLGHNSFESVTDTDTLDWKGGEAPELIGNGLKKLRNGSIILLHAGAKHTAEALPGLIDAAREQGYTFARVGDLIFSPPYEIDHTGRQKKGA